MKYVFALITIVAILSLANAFSPSGPSIEGSLILGDDVNISVQAPRDSITRLTLTTPSGDILGLMHNTKGSFSTLYTPRELGTYTAASEFLELSTTMEANFTVIPGELGASNESNSSINLSLVTDKTNYTLGENVTINSNIPTSISSSLIMRTPSGDLLSLLRNELGSFSILYTPREVGNYTTTCDLLELSTTMEANFTVLAASEGAGNLTPELPELLRGNDTNLTIPDNRTSLNQSSLNETNKTEIPSGKPLDGAIIDQDKNEYELGDEVIIALRLPKDYECDLVIITPSGDALSLQTDSKSPKYTPNEWGEYTVFCENLNISTSFIVTEPEFRPELLREKIKDKLKVKDSKGDEIKVDIRVLDKEKVVFTPREGPVENIVFRNLDVSKDIDLGIDEIPLKKFKEDNFAKVYAIDPTGVDFDNATVTVLATGEELYKCKEWDFENQECGGEWVLFKEGLIPGKEYTFLLTPDDPGFAEVIEITKAMHLDEDLVIISDIFPEVITQDEVWSERIYEGEYIRVSFSRHLRSGNDITIYARNEEGLDTYVEVYAKGSSDLLAEFPIISQERYYKIYLENISPEKSFDLKVVGPADTYLEFDHIIDPYTGGFMLLWDHTADAPAGWTCVSCNPTDPYYQVFIRGEATYGGTGGATTHTHTISYVSETGGATVSDDNSGAVTRASGAHTHDGINAANSDPGNSVPNYRQLKVIQFDGIPITIPADSIAIFNSSTLPAGWTRYAAQDDYILRAGDVSNATGGSDTHDHGVTITTSASTGTVTPRTNGGQEDTADDGHTHSGTGTSVTSLNIPPRLDIIFAKADSDTTIPYDQNFIAMFNETLPTGWDSVSGVGGDFNQRFLNGSATYGGTGGSATNTHPNLAITTGAPSAVATSRTTNQADHGTAAHTHDVTVSFSTDAHLPPYINTIFAHATLDKIAPVITWTWTDINTTTVWRTTNVTLTTSETAAECNLTVDGTLYPMTYNVADAAWWQNLTNFANANYTVWANCSDSSGNLGNSTLAWWNVSFAADAIAPELDWNWTNINSSINTNKDQICVNASEVVNCTLHFNGADYANTTFSTNVCWTRSALADGNYTTINATCDDISDNEANTTNAWLNVDTTDPAISWTWVRNLSSGVSLVNVTILSDEPVFACNVDIDGTNYTMTKNTSTTYYYEWTIVADVNYTLQAYCNDTAENTGVTTLAWYNRDTTTPSLDWNWTDINSTIQFATTEICVNASEPVNCTLDFNGTDYVNATPSTNVCWYLSGFGQGNHSSIIATCEDAVGLQDTTTTSWLYYLKDSCYYVQLRPTASTDSGIATNDANAYDGDDATFATIDMGHNQNPGTIDYHTFTNLETAIITFVNVTFELSVSGTAASDTWALDYSDDAGTNWYSLRATASGDQAKANLTYTVTEQTGGEDGTWNFTEIQDDLQLRIETDKIGGADGATFNLYEVWAYICTEDNPPVVTLNEPADQYVNDIWERTNVTFNCSATDDHGLLNISLYITDSNNQSFSLNQTSAVTGKANDTAWTLELPIGNYTWDCKAFDNTFQSAWSIDNRSIYLNYTDNTPPVISWSNWVGLNITTSDNTTTINWTVNEKASNCTLYFNGTLYENATEGKEFSTAIINVGNGNYSSIYVRCSDTWGNKGQSTTAWWSVNDTSDNPPTSNSPIDQTVELGSSASITWILTDDWTQDVYYVERNGTLFKGPLPWSSGVSLIVAVNTAELGVWNYTIFYNDSIGQSGVPDTVIITVEDNDVPTCAIDHDSESTTPISQSITVDGNMSDWDAIRSNPANYITELTTEAGDPDDVQTGDRDLVEFAFTWDDDNLYTYWRRLTTGTRQISVLVYIDSDYDGYMNSTEKVVKYVWFGQDGKYEADLYNYVPVNATGDGDWIGGNGYTMPGSISVNKTLPDEPSAGTNPGIALETKLNWSEIGFFKPSLMNFKGASGLGSATNLPSQIEDNLGRATSAYSSYLIRYNETGSAANGTFVYYTHEILNCGIANEVFNFDNSSNQGFKTRLYWPNGTELTDTDGDGKPDITLDVSNYTSFVVRIEVPGATPIGTVDITTITVTPTIDPTVQKSIADTTTIGNIAIVPNRMAYGVAGNDVIVNFTISNYQDFSDVIEVTSTSATPWVIAMSYVNGTPLTDTNADTNLDVGTLLSGESITILLAVSIPGGASIGDDDLTTVRINSSTDGTITTIATANVTVADRITIIPNYNRSVGAGASTYYYMTVTNSWNSTDVVDLAYTCSSCWSTTLLALDKITPLTDSDADGLVDTGNLSGYGGSFHFYVKITSPGGAVTGDMDITNVTANSSLDNLIQDWALLNTTVKSVVTYDTAIRILEKTVYEESETIFARAHSLLGINNVYFIWIDSNGTTVRHSPDIGVSGDDDADDEYTTNKSSELGLWTLVTYNAQNDAEVGRAYFTVQDTIDPEVNWTWPEINTTVNTYPDKLNLTVVINETAIACWMNIDSPNTASANYTMIKHNDTSYYYEWTTLVDANYTMTAWCNDTANNTGQSSLAWIDIAVDMWETACGNITGTIYLRNTSVMYNWTWNGVGNLYVFNSDANIDWNNLTALGRTYAGLAATDDFEEVDTVLGTSLYPTSVNITYSTDGSAPQAVQTFVVSTRTLTNVPVANSTNSTNFITGILWDSSDSIGDDEFDAVDNEDLVFVTKINVATAGYCGITDYEIRIPETLDTYTGASGTVDYVTEISL